MVCEGGDGSGYPTMSVLHQDWSPPSPGQTPTLKVSMSSGEAMRMHAAIAALPMRSRNTLVVHYCQRLTIEQQAAALGCQPDTVKNRIEVLHRTLAHVCGL